MSPRRASSLYRLAGLFIAVSIALVAVLAADAAPPEGGVSAAATNPPTSGLNLPFATHMGPIVRDTPANVDVTVDKFGAGIFAVLPAGVFCNEQCSSQVVGVQPGSTVTVAAQPSDGWEVRAWTGCTPTADLASCSTTAAEGTHVHVSFGQVNVVFTAPLRLLSSTSTDTMVVNGETYTFPQNGETNAILPGDFLASVEGAGFLRKAVSLDRHGGVVDVVTTPATLLDVVSEGTLTLGLSSLLGNSGTGTQNTFNIDIPIDQTFGSTHISGDLSASGSLLAEVNVSQGGVTGVHISFTAQVNGILHATSGAVNSPDIPVDDVQGGCFTALFIPVCVDIGLTAQVNVDSQSQVDIGLTVDFSATGSLTFDASGFHQRGTTKKDVRIAPPTDPVKANVDLTLKPTIGLTILGKPAADIAIPVTMTANLDPAMVPRLRAFATVDGIAFVHQAGLFLGNDELGPYTLFSVNEEFYRSPTVGLTLIKAGEGTVSGSDDAHAATINCGLSETRCSAVFNGPLAGIVDKVTLTATPSPGWVVVGWSGGCTPGGSATCSVPMDQSRTVTAIFTHLAPQP